MGNLCVKVSKCCCPIIKEIEETLSITHDPPGVEQFTALSTDKVTIDYNGGVPMRKRQVQSTITGA